MILHFALLTVSPFTLPSFPNEDYSCYRSVSQITPYSPRAPFAVRSSRNPKTCLIYRNCRQPRILEARFAFGSLKCRGMEEPYRLEERGRVWWFFSRRGKFRGCSAIPALYLMSSVISRYLGERDYAAARKLCPSKPRRKWQRGALQRSRASRLFSHAPEFHDIATSSRTRTDFARRGFTPELEPAA